MSQGPEKRDAMKIAQEKRGIPDWGKATAYIRDNEDKKNYMKSGCPVLVHSNPKANQEHGCSCGSKKICQN